MTKKKLTIVIEFTSLVDLFKIFRAINRLVKIGTQSQTINDLNFNYSFYFEYLADPPKPKTVNGKKLLTIKSKFK